MAEESKMRIFLVRHGQTDWNVQDKAQYTRAVPLNKTGKEQAINLSKQFKDVQLTHVYASPTLRTRQTAHAISQAHNIKVIDLPNFVERNPGTLTGLTTVEIRKQIPDIDKQRELQGIDWRPPGNGETIRELITRVIHAWKTVLEEHNPNDCILIVTHAIDVKCIVHYLHGGKPEDIFHTKSPENAEIVEIEYDGKQCKILDKSL